MTLPNIKSAMKRVKVSEKKNLRNRIVKSKIKTAIKKFDAELTANPATVGTQYAATTSAIDKAVVKGILHKNTANRKKSRMAKRMASVAQ